jgi:hypothetical protein
MVAFRIRWKILAGGRDCVVLKVMGDYGSVMAIRRRWYIDRVVFNNFDGFNLNLLCFP